MFTAQNAALVVIILNLVVMILNYFEKKQMQKTIDTLTNKLMAKDYREYVQMGKPPVPVRDDDKPLSWYDH